MLTDRPLTSRRPGPWIELIGQSGGERRIANAARQGRRLWIQSTSRRAGHRRAFRSDPPAQAKPADNLPSLGKLFDHADPSVKTAALRLAGRWKVPELSDRVRNWRPTLGRSRHSFCRVGRAGRYPRAQTVRELTVITADPKEPPDSRTRDVSVAGDRPGSRDAARSGIAGHHHGGPDGHGRVASGAKSNQCPWPVGDRVPRSTVAAISRGHRVARPARPASAGFVDSPRTASRRCRPAGIRRCRHSTHGRRHSQGRRCRQGRDWFIAGRT